EIVDGGAAKADGLVRPDSDAAECHGCVSRVLFAIDGRMGGNAAGSDDRRSTAGPGDWARALGKVYPLLAFEFQKRTHGRCLTRRRSLSVRNFVCRVRRDAISRAAKRSVPARLRPLAREGALWHHPSRPASGGSTSPEHAVD